MKIVFFSALAIIAISICPAFAEVTPTEFLLNYGYLEEKKGDERNEVPTPEAMQKAIIQFQTFNGLQVTGIMDEETAQKMVAPRCGVKDIDKKGPAAYRTVSKWPKNLVTWNIHKYSKTARMSPADQKRAIRRGLHRWGDVSPLEFRETNGEATLDISFEKRNHGDGYPFDGRGMVLAHAFFPTNGDTHFDDDEEWINGKEGGTDLETVAAHEFGHALGLGHSENPRSLMAPYYQVFPNDFKLHQDDVRGIQSLYGKKSPKVTTPQTTPSVTTPPVATRRTITSSPPRGNGFCDHLYNSINAAMRISGNDFVFVDDSDVIDGRDGSKMNIQDLFPGGPSMVQAAVYSRRARKAFLFNGKRVWGYSLDSNGQFVQAKNYPKQLGNSYGYAPESVMQFNYGSERIFVIKNGYFMEFVPYYGYMSPGRGYSTRRFFTNVPHRIDATLSADNEIYFIVGKKAFRMQNNRRTVEIKGKPVNLVFKKCRN